MATYDPHEIFYKFEYDPLHDSHLKRFFTKPINEERILTHSLVNDQNGVICDLKSVNKFRKYLFELLLVKVHQKVKESDEMERMKFRMKNIEQTFEKHFVKAFKKSLLRPQKEILAEKARKRKELLVVLDGL